MHVFRPGLTMAVTDDFDPGYYNAPSENASPAKSITGSTHSQASRAATKKPAFSYKQGNKAPVALGR